MVVFCLTFIVDPKTYIDKLQKEGSLLYIHFKPPIRKCMFKMHLNSLIINDSMAISRSKNY